jgi:glyoxylase-like metal-dependent hydrolase (beta-lactamase superfamily II)
MHRTTLGNLELTILTDGEYFLDGGTFFGVIPKVMWSRKWQPDELNRLRASCNSVLVRGLNKTVLIETGIGNKLNDKMRKIYGHEEKLLKSFEEAGVSPDEVEIVINTHLHFDHCGWNTVYRDGKPVPTFPRAQYYAQEGEWRHGQLQTERDRISYISDNYNPLIESGQMTLLKGDQQILPGLSVRIYPGHTQYMQAVILESEGKKACYISDLIPTTAHIDLAWGMAFDLYPLDTLYSRKKYYAESIPENWLTIFTHDPKTPWGYISQENGKYTFQPLDGHAHSS